MEVRTRSFWVFLALALALSFTGLCQWVIWEEDFETRPLSNLENEVKRKVNWHIVDRAWFHSEPPQIQAFPSGSRALYFGRIEKGRGTYDEAEGEYEKDISKSSAQPSGLYTLDDKAWMRVSFKYVREVEHYEWGIYDETRAALVQTLSVQWFFNKSSKDKSNKEWMSFVSEPILLSSYSVNTAVRFAFNPKDKAHNDYFGWLIDNVKVEAVVVITTSSLPEGYVGQTYSHTLKAEGGVRKNAQYKWKVEGLPEGLQLRDGEIKGILMKAGVYQVKVTVTDYASEASAGRFPDSSFTRIYTLVIKPTEGSGSHAQFAEDFENGEGPDIPGWTRTGLWHRTNAQTVSIKGWVAYFGRDEEKIPNYETKEGRAYGELTSPKWNVADRRGQQVYISFEHKREVEKTGQIGYDKTYVEIRFDDGPWAIVWYMDAKEPQTSGTVCISTYEGKSIYGEPGDPILVPNKALTMQIRFVFDSVDGLYNNYLGWAIDNVQVELKAGELTIVTTLLPDGEVGVYYEAWLEARGGTPPYMWTHEGRLPNGLILDRSGKLYGVPEQTWSSTIVVKVTDKDQNTQTASLSLNIGRKTVLFHDDFSTDKWSYEGLWHRTDQIKNIDLTKHGYVAYYGKDELKSPNYATGARTVGYLTSPRFPIESPAFKVTFNYWREVEFYAPGGYDKTYVEVRFLIGTTWSQWYRIWYKDSAHTSEKTWITASVGPYAIPAGATEMQIRFAFDSVDRFYNNYVGWLVDNVKVEIASSGALLPTSSLDILTRSRGDFAVFNVPNPVRDVHTTTFVVRGVEADLVKVEVYDLTGRLVYVGEALGNELVWHTQDLLGRYLANGVYLYKVYVKVGDTWIVSDVQKIVILR